MEIFQHDEIREEFRRWKRQLPIYGYNDGLSYEDVLTVHFLLADMFFGKSSGIGGIGPKSLDLLISAVSRQHVGFAGEKKWVEPEEIAATLLYGIVLNHPFHDANKRTGFLSTLLILKRNGLTISIKERQLEDFTVTVAERSFRKMEKFKRDFEGTEDADVKYIAHYIKTATRKENKRDYLVTYRELNNILKRFGFELTNPHNNSIDVVRVHDGKRVTNIGFHGMTKQVSKKTIKDVRIGTELDFLSGCDSGAFFKGEIPLNNLLAKYYEPLERLAYR